MESVPTAGVILDGGGLALNTNDGGTARKEMSISVTIFIVIISGLLFLLLIAMLLQLRRCLPSYWKMCLKPRMERTMQEVRIESDLSTDVGRQRGHSAILYPRGHHLLDAGSRSDAKHPGQLAGDRRSAAATTDVFSRIFDGNDSGSSAEAKSAPRRSRVLTRVMPRISRSGASPFMVDPLRGRLSIAPGLSCSSENSLRAHGASVSSPDGSLEGGHSRDQYI